MTRDDLANALAARADESAAAVNRVLDALGPVVQRALVAGDDVTLPGIGKLVTTLRQARKGRNPATGAEIDIPAATVPKLRPAKALRAALND